MTENAYDWRHECIVDHFNETQVVLRATLDQCLEDIIDAAEMIANAFHTGNKLMLCGNGGSAGDCQHLAAEFTSRLTKDFERPALPAIALTTDTSFITAYANDLDFMGIFERQVEALGRPGDVLMGLSTSGNSKNVIQALEYAKHNGIQTIALTGDGGGFCAEHSNILLAIPSKSTQYVQESTIVVYHLLCHIVERILFAEINT